MTRIVGTPRNRSVYAAAMIRIGVKTGPGKLRATAITSASIKTSTSATQKIAMLRTNFCKITGNDDLNSEASKNDCLISGHPGERTTMIARSVKKISVLPTATQTLRAVASPPPRTLGHRPPPDGIGGTPPEVNGMSGLGLGCPIGATS